MNQPPTVLIVGAGAVGLSVARAIQRSISLSSSNILLLDKSSTIATQTSGRNSSVIHAGIYYPQSSLKATLCVKGRSLLLDYCDSHDIRVLRSGKMIVGSNPNPADLQRLLKLAAANDVPNLRLLAGSELNLMEPNIHAPHGGIHSPGTSVFDSADFLWKLFGEISTNGCIDTIFNHTVTSVKPSPSTGTGAGVVVTMMDSANQISSELEVDFVVNAAGIGMNSIEIVDEKQQHITFFAKGNYFKLKSGIPPPFRSLVYPMPDPNGGLGVHSTLDVTSPNTTRFGPDVQWIPRGEQFNYGEDGGQVRRETFYKEIKKYYRGLEREDDLEFEFSGVRPKLYHPDAGQGDSKTMDFVIEGRKQHGMRNVVNLYGIESPGLTSCLAIGEYVVNELGVNHLHAIGVWYRDIKPGNALFKQDIHLRE
ncbi:hypothetical protein ScalyP_jg8421 [Parmales sp. scaly parma]|nr:hypothetical protein ScalyP_jg8421 [Parmales sp. scaly parma]